MHISNSGYVSAFSRHDLPEALPKICPFKKEGSRECRVRAAPAVSCAKLCEETHTSIQVQRKQSDIPCAMALRLMPCSPRRRIRLVTVAAGLMADRSGWIKFATGSLAPATGVGTTRFCRTQPVFANRLRRAWYPSDEVLAKPETAPFVLRACCSLTAMPPCEQTCRADAAASTASQPAFVTIAKRPFPRRDVASDSADLPDGLSGIFFAKGLDRFC